MFFRRNPKVKEKLDKQIIDTQLPSEEVDPAIFSNGTFEELPSVKRWIRKLTGKKVKPQSIRDFIGNLKQICRGELPNGPKIPGWSLKHPDRLTSKDALDWVFHAEQLNLKARCQRITARNFLKANNREGWDDISGQEDSGAGQYAHLYIPPEKMAKILNYVDERNPEAGLACRFAFATGTRLTAVLTADASNMNHEDHTIIVLEKAPRNRPKRRQEKLVPNEIWEKLPKKGLLFPNLRRQPLNNLLRSAYKAVIPELEPKIREPFHCLRHQFAQHLLRATNWNYGYVARLGHWTVETLERYYGKMDRHTALTAGRKFLPAMMAKVTIEAD